MLSYYFFNFDINKLFELDINNIVPIFGLFIAAAFRLLPSVNKLMQGFNNISFHQPSIIMMENEYKKLEKIDNTIKRYYF